MLPFMVPETFSIRELTKKSSALDRLQVYSSSVFVLRPEVKHYILYGKSNNLENEGLDFICEYRHQALPIIAEIRVCLEAGISFVMAPETAEVEEDPRTVALANQLILRGIFSYLPFNDLKKCRLVSKAWNFEAGIYIRDFRQCNASVSDVNLCSDLYELNELVSEMIVVPFNSLSIDFGRYTHTVCKILPDESNVYGQLLDKITLKHLNIGKSMYFGRENQCAGIPLVITLLREKLAELRTLKIDYVCGYIDKVLRDDWTPKLPMLIVLDGGNMWSLRRELLLKLINGAPNLQKLKGNFRLLDLSAFPQDKYRLLDSFTLNAVSEECCNVVEARPALSQLHSSSPFQRQYQRRFFQLLEKLMASSRKTLKKFHMSDLIFPLTRLNFDPIVNLKTLAISTAGEVAQVLNVLRCTDYSERLPALTEIKIVQYPDYEDEELVQLANAAVFNAFPFQPSTSARINKLNLSIDVKESVFQEFSIVFPNVTELVVRQDDVEISTDILYCHLWAHWPLLESIYVTNEGSADNFDADFLGIHPEEVEILRDESDESLEKMNIVPIRPCILTMPRLKSLTIRFFVWQDSLCFFAPDQIFLSKVTGILAFRKLTRMGVRVQLIGQYRDIVSNLTHLVPFASVILDNGDERN